MEKTLAGKTVSVNEEGYLTNFTQWSKEIGVALASDAQVNMTDKHWSVINYLQDEYKHGVPLSIRKIKNSGVVDLKEFYQLFPNGPLKISSKIAGIPKPTSCL